ncbi:MAG: hypothetical protein RR303_06855 [Bacteroidales bacterium]
MNSNSSQLPKNVLFIILFCAFYIISSKTPLFCETNPANHFTNTHEMVTYQQYPPLSDKPIHIFYYIPQDVDVTTAPILFVIPGLDRY